MASVRTLVYLVDDDEMYIKTAVHTFKQNRSFDLKTFSSGEALLTELKKGKKKPDVIVLDYFLNAENPNAISGLEVLKQLGQISKAEVIMLSGQENIDVAVNSVKYGAYDYVVKNKSAFIRVQNNIKRIAKVNRNSDDNRKFKIFLIALTSGVSLFAIACLLLWYDGKLDEERAKEEHDAKKKKELLESQQGKDAPADTTGAH